MAICDALIYLEDFVPDFGLILRPYFFDFSIPKSRLACDSSTRCLVLKYYHPHQKTPISIGDFYPGDSSVWYQPNETLQGVSGDSSDEPTDALRSGSL